MLVHCLSLLLLLGLVLLHVLLKVRLKLFYVVNFNLLLLQLCFSLLQFLMLVSKSVNFGLQLVGLLLFDHFNISLRNFLNLSEARMAEPVASEVYLNQSHIFIERLQHHSLDRLAKEIVG
jgi:hypothetical protein